MDDDDAARRLVAEVLPRLATLWKKAKVRPGRTTAADDAAGFTTATRSLGRPGGRPLDAAAHGRMVLVGWGDRALETMVRTAEHPEESVLPLIVPAGAGPAREPLARLAERSGRDRCGFRSRGLTARHHSFGASPRALRSSGRAGTWRARARDRLRWDDLHGLVQRFLAAIPLDPSIAH